LIPFEQDKSTILVSLSNFVNEVWLRPDDMEPDIMLKRIKPLYWPMWLVDSDLAGIWTSEAGYTYQVKSSQESYVNGSWRSQDKIESRLRWEPRVGQVIRHYDNVAVPALDDQNDLLNKVGSYQFNKAVPYKAEKANNSYLRVPDLEPASVWPDAQVNVNHAAENDCVRATGAAQVRNFALKAEYHTLNWTQLLLPLYATYYTDDEGQKHPVLINGQSGKIGGIRLASQRKGWKRAGIAAAIAASVFILGLILLLAGAVVPPIAAIGLLLAVAGFGVAIYAVVPAVWPWQWNRKQREQKITSR
jgi:hypothetical protein